MFAVHIDESLTVDWLTPECQDQGIYHGLRLGQLGLLPPDEIVAFARALRWVIDMQEQRFIENGLGSFLALPDPRGGVLVYLKPKGLDLCGEVSDLCREGEVLLPHRVDVDDRLEDRRDPV